MDKRSILFTFLLAIIFVSINSQNAPAGTACTCTVRNLSGHISASPLIFSGRVANIVSADNLNKIYFYINTVFKGRTTTSRMIINTPKTSNACGYNFIKGGDYLVYTQYDNNRKLQISACSRTKLLDNSCEDLTALSRYRLPAVRPSS
jgi:hypothetical protein